MARRSILSSFREQQPSRETPAETPPPLSSRSSSSRSAKLHIGGYFNPDDQVIVAFQKLKVGNAALCTKPLNRTLNLGTSRRSPLLRETIWFGLITRSVLIYCAQIQSGGERSGDLQFTRLRKGGAQPIGQQERSRPEETLRSFCSGTASMRLKLVRNAA